MTVTFPLIPAVSEADTTDIYFHRSVDILAAEGIDPAVTIKVFARKHLMLAGVTQVAQLLDDIDFKGMWHSGTEGQFIPPTKTAMVFTCHYSEFCLYETAILGILASSSAWATAAWNLSRLTPKPIACMGARHIHPNVAAIMDYCAILGGCSGCSTPLGALLANSKRQPVGTMPHSLVLIMGDTLRALEAFDRHTPDSVARIALVDTFQDEAVESLRLARAFPGLAGVRLDTASERGGVTPDLVREVRARLDLEGFTGVKIIVSGGFGPEKIQHFEELQVPVDMYGVGAHIAHAVPIDFTADIVEIKGKRVAKKGRIPGGSIQPETLTRMR